MTAKYEKFMDALERLCLKHDIELRVDGEFIAVDEGSQSQGRELIKRDEFRDHCCPF
jgi:hypothetical protein